MKKDIAHNLFFNHTPEDVWEYLTKPELIELWLMKNDFQAKVGHQFHFWTRPLPQFDFDGVAYCRVLDIMPFKKLSYSWKGGPGNGVMTLDSIVEWTLVAKENGTELQLVHKGFKELENYMIFAAMNEGWLKNMQKIGTLLNDAKNGTGKS